MILGGLSGSGEPIDGKFNYVVIGAFSIPKNAIEFTENARKNKLGAQFSINPVRKLFYVYVMETGKREDAIEEAKKLRKETSYYDTWVFTGNLGEENSDGADVNPVTGKGIETIEASDSNPNQQNSTPPGIDEMPAGGKNFFFKIFSGEKEIPGDIDVMDRRDKGESRKIASYRGNEVVSIKPVNSSGNISLQCDVFGYRKVQQPLNFNEPQLTEGVKMEEGKIIVPFDLVRLKKGDFAIMYNVYFYKDAGVMRPESRYEVTSLLEMLQENPKYKIRIHGHTNGNAGGKIIFVGTSQNFFSLKDTRNGSGSAKKLSEERAKVIQSYLVSRGIDPTRMEIKAWGGTRPIYKEDAQNAHANVRVEIEILQD